MDKGYWRVLDYADFADLDQPLSDWCQGRDGRRDVLEFELLLEDVPNVPSSKAPRPLKAPVPGSPVRTRPRGGGPVPDRSPPRREILRVSPLTGPVGPTLRLL